MRKSFVITLLLLVPLLLIGSGFYFEKDMLASIGYVILIFYIIMAVRGRFTTGK
jgi:hypothetical protein